MGGTNYGLVGLAALFGFACSEPNPTTTSGGPASGSSTTGNALHGTSPTASTTGLEDIPPPTFDTVVTVLTQNPLNCTSADCHGGVPGRIDFRPDPAGVPPLYERLTTWDSDVCGKLVVSPGNPDHSAILQVLTTGCGNVVPNCAIGTECIPRMPLECEDDVDCIPPNYIEAIRQWIKSGAPPP